MDDLCNIKINPVLIACDTSLRPAITVMAERLADGTIVVLNAETIPADTLKQMADEFEKARAAGEKMNEALKVVPELPAIHTPMRPHSSHAHDAFSYYLGNNSRNRYRVPKHHLRKTGRR